MNFSYEPVSPADYSLQITRLRGVILQGAANLADCGVDSLLDVDKNIFAPEFVGDLVTREQLSGILCQVHQELQRQTLERNRLAIARELKAAKIQFVPAELDFLPHSPAPA